MKYGYIKKKQGGVPGLIVFAAVAYRQKATNRQKTTRGCSEDLGAFRFFFKYASHRELDSAVMIGGRLTEGLDLTTESLLPRSRYQCPPPLPLPLLAFPAESSR